MEAFLTELLANLGAPAGILLIAWQWNRDLKEQNTKLLDYVLKNAGDDSSIIAEAMKRSRGTA